MTKQEELREAIRETIADYHGCKDTKNPLLYNEETDRIMKVILERKGKIPFIPRLRWLRFLRRGEKELG